MWQLACLCSLISLDSPCQSSAPSVETTSWHTDLLPPKIVSRAHNMQHMVYFQRITQPFVSLGYGPSNLHGPCVEINIYRDNCSVPGVRVSFQIWFRACLKWTAIYGYLTAADGFAVWLFAHSGAKAEEWTRPCCTLSCTSQGQMPHVLCTVQYIKLFLNVDILIIYIHELVLSLYFV